MATGITWMPFGDLDQMTRGNGTLYSALYDQSYRMTGQTDLGGTALRDIAYGYSLRDNLTAASDLLDASENVTYGYDPRQMLESADGPWGALGWTYDPVGNRASRSLAPPGGPAAVDTYQYAVDSNRLEQIAGAGLLRSYTHDGAGNTSAEGRVEGVTLNWTYSYNPLNRLASVAVNGVHQADYRYNALGQQVHRDVGGTVTLSVHDLAGNRIAEHDGAGVVLREYIWLDGLPLAVVEGGQVYWLHWDHILRPVLATGATGAVVWAARYLPFGGIDQVSVDTGALTQTLRFPGQWFQAETGPGSGSGAGLHQNWMRDYDPTTGRYLQADPLGLVDGASVYGYARQNPVRWTDPRGMDTVTLGAEIEIITGLGAGGSIGFLANYHCGVLTVGTFETVKGGVGLDVSPSVYLQYTGGSLPDFTGDSLTAEIDIGVFTGEAGRTESGELVLGAEFGVQVLMAGGSVTGSRTIITKKASVDLATALDWALRSLGINSQPNNCGCGTTE